MPKLVYEVSTELIYEVSTKFTCDERRREERHSTTLVYKVSTNSICDERRGKQSPVPVKPNTVQLQVKVDLWGVK